MLREVKPDDVLPQENTVAARLKALRARLANVREDMVKIQDDLRGGYSKALAAVLREKEAEEERVAGQLQDELAKSVRPAEKAMEQFPGLVDMIIKNGDEARIKIRPVLREFVEQGLVLFVRRGSWQLCFCQFWFQGGSQRSYLLGYQSAAYHRPSRSWAASVAALASATPLDLRVADHVAVLEAALLAVDLDNLGDGDIELAVLFRLVGQSEELAVKMLAAGLLGYELEPGDAERAEKERGVPWGPSARRKNKTQNGAN
jgi:hypothetical protein